MNSLEDIEMTYWEEYDGEEIGLWHDVLVGEHIEMYVLTEDDAERLFALTNNNRTHLRQWLPWIDDTRTVEDTRDFIASSLRRYKDDMGMSCGIFYKGDLAGVISLNTIDWLNYKTEIGYWLGAEFQGLGLITRACRAMIDHAFLDLELNKVEIRCATGNSRSCAIPQRLGFTQEGVIRQGEWLYDHYVDLVLYGLLSSEWKTKVDE